MWHVTEDRDTRDRDGSETRRGVAEDRDIENKRHYRRRSGGATEDRYTEREGEGPQKKETLRGVIEDKRHRE